jgi:REP element-mobilizing transposase RayT
MTYDPDSHHRRSIRLKGYDYSEVGAYFVTICAQNRECLFGDVVDEKMRVNDYGRIAGESWEWVSRQYGYVDIDEWVVMPNHLHGILIIHDDCRGGSQCKGGSRTAPTETVKRKSLGRLIGAFKTVSSKQINQIRNTPGHPVWQRNYYEHIIRSEEEMDRIREYIIENPMRWADDEDNPANITHCRGGSHCKGDSRIAPTNIL